MAGVHSEVRGFQFGPRLYCCLLRFTHPGRFHLWNSTVSPTRPEDTHNRMGETLLQTTLQTWSKPEAENFSPCTHVQISRGVQIRFL